jgi:predicted short-subunit dehydrogenase-like oxidoreductase (DUF2520 family)
VTHVAIIGPGRAGTAIHDRCQARGVDSILTRTPAQVADAGIVLLAVPDDAIAAVAASIPAGPWLGMLSGATPLTALGWGPRRFVLHPAQTLTVDGGAAQLDGVTAFVTGAAAEALAVAEDLAARLGLRSLALPEAQRPLPHVACVIASNYLVALEAAAVDLLVRTGIEQADAVAALRPLVERTVANALGDGGSLQPTGPVARGDAGTIERHMTALGESAPGLVPLYRLLGEATLPLVAPDAAARAAAALHRQEPA